MVFSEAAALSSSSVQNVVSASIWLKSCKTNSGKESEPGKISLCLKVQVLGNTRLFRIHRVHHKGIWGGLCCSSVCFEMTMDACEGEERDPEGKGMKGSC